MADNPLKFDPVKAATASALIKQGFSEEAAFTKAGITEVEYGTYSIDDVPGSPTRGQIIKGPGGNDYTEEQAAQNKAANDAAKQSWVDEEVKAETAGPIQTRTTSSVVTTGGAERVTKMTPEMSNWVDKSNTAAAADEAATQSAKQEYLRTQGLDGASPSARRAALREAEASGQNFTVTSNKDALGTPPANQYTTETIQPNLTGDQTPNDGAQTPEQGAKESAAGQTAEQQANNNIPATVTGAGQGNNSPTPIVSNGEQSLSSSELSNLENTSNQPTTAAPTTGDESKSTEMMNSSSLRDKIDNAGNQSGTVSVGNDNNDPNTSAAAQNIPGSFLTNRLHDFTGYTYNISLFLLTADDYQSLSAKPTNFYPKWTIISSGGGIPADAPKSTTMWHPDFQEDFYFDNLNIKTVVGLNSRSKGSNLIEIKFNIIEPYGMSLLDRLLSACQTTCDSPNYIDQPYLLQIDFLANPTEADTNGISGHLIDRKRVAIKFMEFKIKPGANGTTYAITARPYNHVAFDQSVAAVPVNLSVEAATVGDYFDSREELQRIFDKSATKDEERIESEINNLPKYGVAYVGASGKNAQEELQKQKEQIRASSFYSTKSYPAAYNTYYKNVAYQEGRTENPLSQVLFNIHPDIANSPIIDTNAMDSSSTSMNEIKSSATAGTATGTNKDFKTKSVYQVLAGTDIVTLIDRVISSSKYIKDQVEKAKTADEQQAQQDTTSSDPNARYVPKTNTNKDAKKYQTTKWYKVTPTVTLGLYDKKAKAYSKTITYSILPYQTGNFYHPDFKQTKVTNKKCIRTYNYYYTGLNQDILQLDVDFDATFVTGITTFAKQLERRNTHNGADAVIDDSAPSLDTKPSWLPKRIVVTPSDGQMTGQKGKTPEDAIVGSVARSLYSSYPRGDMLNIKMRIVGDPAFIKQDDMLYQPTSKDYKPMAYASSSASPPINVNTGQIIFDSEEVYVQLIVKGVIDIDDTIGITNKSITLSNGQTTNGSFSGVYRVMTVTSEFSKGKFEQIVELIRVPDDLVEIENAPKISVTTQSVASTTADIGLSGTVAGPVNIANLTPPNVPPVDQALKDIANGPITNPIPGIQIQGRPFQDQVPSDAYPTNVNNTPFTI